MKARIAALAVRFSTIAENAPSVLIGVFIAFVLIQLGGK